MPGAAPLLVVLTGPTGTGKSTLALQLVAQLQGRIPLEIISMDSAQVYRGMDIGTAKPTVADRASVPHHLIDIRDPAQGYSAGEFVRDALQAARQIHARGAVPLIVGGTLLYLRALYHGLAVLPQADAALRAEIDAQARQFGWPVLHAELMRVDPIAAARIAASDAQRIQRALEVWRLTGAPISQWQQRTQGAREQFRWLRFALLPADDPAGRAALRERLAVRLRGMLEAGLLAEVQRLYARGDLTERHAAVRAVGYRQLWRVFSAGATLPGAEQSALIATAQLAKRQLTWLRREPELTRMGTAAVGLAEALSTPILAAACA